MHPQFVQIGKKKTQTQKTPECKKQRYGFFVLLKRNIIDASFNKKKKKIFIYRNTQTDIHVYSIAGSIVKVPLLFKSLV